MSRCIVLVTASGGAMQEEAIRPCLAGRRGELLVAYGELPCQFADDRNLRRAVVVHDGFGIGFIN